MPDTVKDEITLLEIEKIEIEFSPEFFITRTMETFQSS
jgi:hypothetical protein